MKLGGRAASEGALRVKNTRNGGTGSGDERTPSCLLNQRIYKRSCVNLQQQKSKG